MQRVKTYSFLLTLLCLLVSQVVKAQGGFVHPTLTDDNEVCIFFLSSDDVTYRFYGEGDNYSGGSAAPGDEFVKVGQQEDGLYLYKWTRPDGATGIPQKFTIYKNGTAESDIIYNAKNYVNHGVYIEAKESSTTTSDEVAYNHTVAVSSSGTAQEELAVVENENEHSVFFETPKQDTYYAWPYNGAIGGDHYTNGGTAEDPANGSFPGDKLVLLGQLSNGNYLYKWTQTHNTSDEPKTIIFSKSKINPTDENYPQYPGLDYENHGYYVNTITSATSETKVYQFGKAYVTNNNPSTSSLTPLAQLDAANEVSIFLEAPEKKDFHLWAFRSENGAVTQNGTYFTGTVWPGTSFTYVGQLSEGGPYLYKWTMNPHIDLLPTAFSICDNGASDATALEGAHDIPFNNHGYYRLGNSGVDYVEAVTRRSDGSYSTNRTIYGKRVIYEMNVGSFTTEGTFNAAKARLDYLKNLGVDVIWLMPVYERRTPDEGSTGSSPYAVKDFKAPNPNYGSVADLKDFVTTAHELGMDVWLDFVANHTATDNAWVTTHPEYYSKNAAGEKIHPTSGSITYNDVWQLDYTTTQTDESGNTYNPATVAVEDAMKYWLEQTDIDGFRFDMVSSQTITSKFWDTVTKDLKAIKPSLQFLAEADFSRDKNVSPSDFQYDYSWAFNENLSKFGDSNITYVKDGTTDLSHITKKFLDDSNKETVNHMVYLSNHDTNWGTNADGKYTMKDIWADNRYAMTVLEFTMPGMPLIYNGQEQNGTVKLDYFNDTKINWSSTMDYKMLGLITELSELKHTNNAVNDGDNSALRGETRILNAYANDGVFAYERIKGDQHVLVVLNLANTPKASTILGATKGTWSRILKGDNTGIDNTVESEDIDEVWHLLEIPAHGFEIYTYTGSKQNFSTGIYFVADDNGDDLRTHQMDYVAQDDNYDYYRFVVNSTDFDKLSTKPGSATPESKLSFKFQEYYDFLGTVCRNDKMYGAGSHADYVFTVNGTTKQYGFVKNDDANNNAFGLEKGTEADNVSKYIITFQRSRTSTDEGIVTLQIIKEGELQPGYYLITPINVQTADAAVTHQWRFKAKYEDESAVSDRYFANLNEDMIDLCSYTIDADQFGNYIPADRKATNTIQFRIRQLGYDTNNVLKDNAKDIDPDAADANNDKSTFDASKDDSKVYEDSHWDAYTDNSAFFKIVYQPDVSKYIIQMWKTSQANSGKTRVRVYYVRKYNYQGSTIDAVTASNEDVYLYNVDAQKFLYVGNTWGTMASLLYDDLGTRLNISEGKTDENSDYRLIRTRMENNTTVPDGHMLGIDDWSYDRRSNDPANRLDAGFIYTDRDNGNRWIFEKADNISYANTYTLKLFDRRDGRYHYLIGDHMDGNSDEAKRVNTRVRYEAADPNVDYSTVPYARWQLVTYSDLVNKLKNENADLYGGTTADATFLMKDQGFTRYIQNTWDTDRDTDGSTVNMKKNAIGDYPDTGMYWNGRITGHGKVYQDVEVPMYGIYQFDAYGFYHGSETQLFYQYATEFNADGTVKTWSSVLGNTPLKSSTTTYVDRQTDIATGEMFYNESVLGGNPEHLNTQFIYVPQDAAKDKNGNYRIRVGFHKLDSKDGDYTAVDDVHLHYTGKSPFVLDDSWDETTKNTKYASDDRENVPVWIKRKFFVDTWNSLILPVSVTTTQLRAMFGDDVELASPYGLDDDDPYLIRFTMVDLTSGSRAIEAGKYYIVRPKKLVGTSKVMTLNRKADNTYEPAYDEVSANDNATKFYNLGSHDLKGLPTKVDTLGINTYNFHSASAKHPEHNTISIIGSFSATQAPGGSYVFTSKGKMKHIINASPMGGYRFFIVDNDVASPAKSFMIGSLTDDLDSLLASYNKQKDGGATGIKEINTTGKDNSQNDNGDVYDLSGRRVATNGVTDNLPKGVYIRNGKKFIKN